MYVYYMNQSYRYRMVIIMAGVRWAVVGGGALVLVVAIIPAGGKTGSSDRDTFRVEEEVALS